MITKEEWEIFIKLQKEIDNLVKEKTIELCKILYNRKPQYDYVGYDIDNNILFVTYEDYINGEVDKEEFKLPIEFLYDKNYPQKFKELHEEKLRELEKWKKTRLKEEKEKQQREFLEFEKSEYERLKKKFT